MQTGDLKIRIAAQLPEFLSGVDKINAVFMPE